MSSLITFCIFCICFLTFVPVHKMFRGSPFRKVIDIVLSRGQPTSFSSSYLLQKVTPILHIIIRLFRIKTNYVRWDPYRNKLATLYVNKEVTVEQFIALKILAACLVFLYMLLLNVFQPSPFLFLLGMLLTLISYYIPDQLLNIQIKKRKWEIYRDIPSILLSLAVTTDAGLSLNQALEEICSVKTGALTEELRKTLQQISVGIPQKEAFEGLATRVRIDEITMFVSVLTQTLEKGSSGITHVLREQANESWAKRKGIAKELAGKASIKLFLPMIGLVLPALMIFLIVPAVFSILKFFKY